MSVVNIVVKVFHIWHSDPYMDGLRPCKVSWRTRNNFRIRNRSWR